MKKLALLALVLPLTACSPAEVAATAADAAACKALTSTLDGLSDAYQKGLVDSGVLERVDELVGDQLDTLLSSELAGDLGELTAALGESETAEGAQQRLDEAISSITQRCAKVGVRLD